MAKILIVEDNALNIKLFCDLLAAHGHEPEAVTDSRFALDAARAILARPGDHRYPASARQRARAHSHDAQGRGAARSPDHGGHGLFGEGDEERIRAAGAQAYVSKPISVVRFAETVEQLLKRSRDADRDRQLGERMQSMDPDPGEAGGEES